MERPKSLSRARERSLFWVYRQSRRPEQPLWQSLAKHSQIALRIRDFLLARARKKRENFYTSLEKVGDRAHAPISARALSSFWQTRKDFISLLSADGVEAMFVSQANLAHSKTIQEPDIREKIDNDLVGMTLPILVETLEALSHDGEYLCASKLCSFVDAYRMMPPTLENFVDHVHLTNKGEEVLGEPIAEQSAAAIHRACGG